MSNVLCNFIVRLFQWLRLSPGETSEVPKHEVGDTRNHEHTHDDVADGFNVQVEELLHLGIRSALSIRLTAMLTMQKRTQTSW